MYLSMFFGVIDMHILTHYHCHIWLTDTQCDVTAGISNNFMAGSLKNLRRESAKSTAGLQDAKNTAAHTTYGGVYFLCTLNSIVRIRNGNPYHQPIWSSCYGTGTDTHLYIPYWDIRYSRVREVTVFSKLSYSECCSARQSVSVLWVSCPSCICCHYTR